MEYEGYDSVKSQVENFDLLTEIKVLQKSLCDVSELMDLKSQDFDDHFDRIEDFKPQVLLKIETLAENAQAILASTQTFQKRLNTMNQYCLDLRQLMEKKDSLVKDLMTQLKQLGFKEKDMVSQNQQHMNDMM